MIEFENYYYIAAEEIALIETKKGDTDYPYILSVTLKSGKTVSVSYKTKEARDVARRRMANQISMDLRQDWEQIHNRLYLLNDAVKRVDKRQLRIWRILSKLLHIDEKEASET